MGGSNTEQDQGWKDGGQATPSSNSPAELECKLLYAKAHCHEEELYASCSE
jgi:hypothetical protein